jgi:hypothetical protein
MLIKPEIFELHKLADCQPSRFRLDGVRIERATAKSKPIAVVTDGRCMLVARWPEDDVSEYPDVGLSTDRVDDFGVIVPAEACKKAAKLPPKRTPKAVLRNVLLDEANANGKVAMAATDLESVDELRPTAIEGRYPKWVDCILSEDVLSADNSVSIKLSAKLLIDVLQTLVKVGGAKDADVTMTVAVKPNDPDYDTPLAARGHDNPLTLTAVGENGAEICGVIMPLACDRKEGSKRPAHDKPLMPGWVPRWCDAATPPKPSQA